MSVSVNELLNGEEIPKENAVDIADRNLMYICQNVTQIKKRNRQSVIVLIVAILVVSALLAVPVIGAMMGYLDRIKGSENCVIAEDYSYITYYGEKYVPLDTGEYQCSMGEKIVDEAKVENCSITTKLMFGDSVYAVKGVADSSIIYLQTDYDDISTEYYVRESKAEEMQTILSDFTDEYVCAVIIQKDDYIKELILDDELSKITKTSSSVAPDTQENCEFNRSKGEESIQLITYEPDLIFYRTNGEILYKNEKYYWCDYENYLNEDVFADELHPYPIDVKYYEKLDELFSYMYE